MAKVSKGKGADKGEHEFRPDGWQRFERAVDAAVKSGPKHRIKPGKAEKSAGRSPKKVD